MRQVLRALRAYHVNLTRLCDEPLLYAWLSVYGAAMPLVAHTSFATLAALEAVAAIVASIASMCRAYLGLRYMLPSVVYAHVSVYTPMLVEKVVLGGDALASLLAAVATTLLGIAALYDEALVLKRVAIRSFLLNDALENTILSLLGVLASLGLYLNGYSYAASFATVVAYYPLYLAFRQYFSNVVGWDAAPQWEKLFAFSVTASYAALAAFYALS